MMRIAFALLLGGLLPGVCFAQSPGTRDGGGGVHPARAASKFFYTVPEGIQDEWAYAMPECTAISSPADLDLRNCISFEKHQMCESSKSVELTNVLNNEKREFMLLHHIFSTKKACSQSRQATIKGH